MNRIPVVFVVTAEIPPPLFKPGRVQFIDQKIGAAVGVGIGGGADLALKLAKKSLLRPVGSRHTYPPIADIEIELIERINKSGIGPMGLGGKTTVLDVHIEKAHRHPASLPVGISVQCWADRRAQMIIHSNGTLEVM